jgi:hypothetical protein
MHRGTMKEPKLMTCEEAVRWHASSLGAVVVIVFLNGVAGAGFSETEGLPRLSWTLCILANIVLAFVIMRTNAAMCFMHGKQHGFLDGSARTFVAQINESRRRESESPGGPVS